MTLTGSIQREERKMWDDTKYWLSAMAIVSMSFILAVNLIVMGESDLLRTVVLGLSIVIGIIFVFFPVAILVVSRPVDNIDGELAWQ